MSPDVLTTIILEYRYWILIPLSFIEGPAIAFVAGTLAAVNYFNIYTLAGFFLVRDMGLDSVYYAIGHFGGKTAFVKRMLAKAGVTDDQMVRVRNLWERRPGWTMFIGKLSYGIAAAFIVAAGAIGMPLKKFFGYGIMVAVLQYGTLLTLGYYLGSSAGGNVIALVEHLQYLIAGTTIVVVAYYIISWRMRRRFIAEKEKEMLTH